MSLRPTPARWFEILTARDTLSDALQTLARTDCVQLEARSEIHHSLLMPDLHDHMEEYHRLARRYQRYWPEAETDHRAPPGRLKDKLDQALAQLFAWQQAAEPLITRLESLQNEQTELELVAALLQHAEFSQLELDSISRAGPSLASRLFVLPVDARIEQLPPALLCLQARNERHRFLLVVGATEEVAELQRELALNKARVMLIPDWLQGKPAQAQQQVTKRLGEIGQQTSRLQQQLATLAEQHQLGKALANIHQLEWFLTHVTELPVSENFAWITGWTSDPDGSTLQQALSRAHIPAMVHFPDAPLGSQAPMVIHNPGWARPFEFFTRMLGTPAADEAEPSRLLAFIVPLLFGFMFGDVGHGLVLVVAGLAFARRWPLLRVFIPCGLVSMVFGVLFGSVFGNEQLIPALWLHPIDQPLSILLTALVGGAGIIVLGLLLNSLEALWRGEARRWLLSDAPLLVMYLTILGSYLLPWAAALLLAALLWYLLGQLLLSDGHYLKTLGLALGKLLETLLQLLVNTFSFIRVGAFALAHAGLSLAFVILAKTTGNILLSGLILLVGNIIVIMLEGLVVSIQTTRLVLFEFFIRFLRGTGRLFSPLPAPGKPPSQPTRRTS